jgi:hypothetical protein
MVDVEHGRLMTDDRTERMQQRFVVPVTIAALLVILSMLLNRAALTRRAHSVSTRS